LEALESRLALARRRGRSPRRRRCERRATGRQAHFPHGRHRSR